MNEKYVKLNDYGYPVIEDKISDPREVQPRRIEKVSVFKRISVNIVKFYNSLKG